LETGLLSTVSTSLFGGGGGARQILAPRHLCV